MLRLIPYSLKTPLLQRAFSPARNVGAVTPSRSQSSHSLMAVALMSVGMMMLPSVVMIDVYKRQESVLSQIDGFVPVVLPIISMANLWNV